MNIVSGLLCKRPFLAKNLLSQSLYVACGSCVYCDQSRTSVYRDKIRNELQNSSYAFFLTLTYAPEYGTYYHRRTNTISRYVFNPITGVGRRENKALSCFSAVSNSTFSNATSVPFVIKAHKGYRVLNTAVGLEDFDMVALGYDITSFIKRLRISIARDLKVASRTIKFRYSFVSEYGKTTKRPHFHGVVVFDNPLLLRYFTPEFVSQAWRLGVCNEHTCELIRNKSASSTYISKYCSKLLRGGGILDLAPFAPRFHNSRNTPFGITGSPLNCIRVALSSYSSFSEAISFIDKKTKNQVSFRRKLYGRLLKYYFQPSLEISILHNDFFKGLYSSFISQSSKRIDFVRFNLIDFVGFLCDCPYDVLMSNFKTCCRTDVSSVSSILQRFKTYIESTLQLHEKRFVIHDDFVRWLYDDIRDNFTDSEVFLMSLCTGNTSYVLNFNPYIHRFCKRIMSLGLSFNEYLDYCSKFFFYDYRYRFENPSLFRQEPYDNNFVFQDYSNYFVPSNLTSVPVSDIYKQSYLDRFKVYTYTINNFSKID